MTLTEKDKALFLSWDYTESDLSQLQDAVNEVRLTLINCDDEQRITKREAIRILGRETFLSGIGRAAFHATSARESSDGKIVYFDLHKWWRYDPVEINFLTH